MLMTMQMDFGGCARPCFCRMHSVSCKKSVQKRAHEWRSPEVLVRVEDDVVTVRPIAGTRKRGANEAEDQALEKDLLADPKEIAEHLMLISPKAYKRAEVKEFTKFFAPRYATIFK